MSLVDEPVPRALDPWFRLLVAQTHACERKRTQAHNWRLYGNQSNNQEFLLGRTANRDEEYSTNWRSTNSHRSSLFYVVNGDCLPSLPVEPNWYLCVQKSVNIWLFESIDVRATQMNHFGLKSVSAFSRPWIWFPLFVILNLFMDAYGHTRARKHLAFCAVVVVVSHPSSCVWAVHVFIQCCLFRSIRKLSR